MSRTNLMLPVANLMPRFAGMTALAGSLRTYAPSPVWSDSTTKTVKFQPLPKKAATRIWHRARDFDRQTRRKNCHGGAVGHAALQVLHTLIFDFLNYASGQLDPSYAAIARKANVCERTVANALQRLRELGILNWYAAAPRSGSTGGMLLSRRRTPMLSCRRHNGGATGSRRSRRRPHPAHGATIRPCPHSSTRPSPSGASAATCGR